MNASNDLIHDEVLLDFSHALDDTLNRLDARITAIGDGWDTQQTSITVLQTDIDVLTVDTDQLKIDVTTLMNNYDDLSVSIDNQQAQLDTLEGLYGDAGDKAQ